MVENERIKQLRKGELGLTLEEFGNRIGLQKSAISKIERGENGVTDQTRLSICREFRVSETWLRTGEGEMFAPQSREEEIEAAVQRLLSGQRPDFKRRLVTVLSALNEDQWEVLEEKLLEIAGDRAGPEIKARQEAEAYYQDLLTEKEPAEKSSALPDTSEPTA